MSILATKRGFIEVISNKGIHGRLENILYSSSEIPYNLLSVRRLQEKGMTVVFDKEGVTIWNGDTIIITGKPMLGLMGITFIISNRVANLSNKICKETHYELWHKRLGHVSRDKFIELKKLSIISTNSAVNKV